jgi:hypothetical protein
MYKWEYVGKINTKEESKDNKKLLEKISQKSDIVILINKNYAAQ